LLCGVHRPRLQLSKRIKQRVEEFYEQYANGPKPSSWRNHGLIAAGKSVKDVQTITAMYVKTPILLGTYALGGPTFSPRRTSIAYTPPDEHYRQRQIGKIG